LQKNQTYKQEFCPQEKYAVQKCFHMGTPLDTEKNVSMELKKETIPGSALNDPAV